MRWIYVLACTHSVAADDPAAKGDICFCPDHGADFPILDSYLFQDDDV